MAKLEKFEITEFGPFRFIGKTVYAPPGSGEIFGSLWGNSKEIFDVLDRLTEYATEEMSNVAYMNWSAEKNQLGYTVGRFMRADTPIPEGLDSIEIPKQSVAKSLVSGEFDDMISEASGLTEEAIKRQNEYDIAWDENFIGAEVYPRENIPESGVRSVLGYYIPCKKKANLKVADFACESYN